MSLRIEQPIAVRELLAAGVILDAVTDTDVGPDECRLVCEVDVEGDTVVTSYRVEFLQLRLSEALACREPTWQAATPWRSHQNNGSGARLSALQANAMERLLPAPVREQIEATVLDAEEC